MPLLVNPWVFLTWILLSWGIAELGREKRFGFIGHFLISLVFSPLVGAIVLLAGDNRMKRRR